jgi:N-acetyl-gamma-glutamyl-phosphate reductase
LDPSVPQLFLGFVGLPDAASIEAAGFVESDNDRTVIIDASTAYRVDDDWAYGFPGTFNSAVAKIKV